MFTLRQIEVFNAVMQTGSVIGAAKMLNVSQPVVSRVLRHLEDQTKVPLFERSKGRLQPTYWRSCGPRTHWLSELSTAV